jgi:hypothetical protein
VKRFPRQAMAFDADPQSDDDASQHITFSTGMARSSRNGEIYKALRQRNIEKTTQARACRPHKVG